jgi:hypothetical protein
LNPWKPESCAWISDQRGRLGQREPSLRTSPAMTTTKMTPWFSGIPEANM